MNFCLAAEGATSGREKLREFLVQLQEEVNKLNQFVLQAKSEAQVQDDLEELAIFAETNRIACHKIVKKFHKNCGPWDELQLFLEHLLEEPFLASLSEELPKARTTMKTRLSLAGVCRDLNSPHGDTAEGVWEDHASVQESDVSSNGTDFSVHITIEEPNMPS